MKKKDNNNFFIIILFVIVIIFVFLLKYIYKYMENIENKENNSSIVDIDKNEEEEIIDETILDSLHFPIMRNSIYDKNTYYTQDTFTISNMSNNDILFNALLDVYEGNMISIGSYGCTTNSKQINSQYIDLRVKNILGKDINYTLDTFNVPEGSSSNYPGTWVYDANVSKFTYYGLCKSNISNIRYYNLEDFIKVEEEDNSIVVYYYVGFASVEGNNYKIYKDANMTEEIKSGTISDVSELNTIYSEIENSKKNIYKYTFKDTLCSYNEYCLYEGKWVNEL